MEPTQTHEPDHRPIEAVTRAELARACVPDTDPNAAQAISLAQQLDREASSAPVVVLIGRASLLGTVLAVAHMCHPLHSGTEPLRRAMDDRDAALARLVRDRRRALATSQAGAL